MTAKENVKRTLKMFVPPALIKIYKRLKRARFLQRKALSTALKACSIAYANELDFPDVFKVTREDYKFPFYLRANSSDVHVYKSIIENGEYSFVSSGTPEVMIDGGANIGMAAVYFAAKYPDATIISIEPEADNFKLLLQNTKNYPNVIALQAALWDRAGEITLLDTGLDSWGFMTDDGSNADQITTPRVQKKYPVKTVTIEGLLNDYHLGIIDILKIDIEGAEKEVFEDHASWVNDVRAIIVELHERMKPGCEKAFSEIARKFDEVALHGENYYLSKPGFMKKR